MKIPLCYLRPALVISALCSMAFAAEDWVPLFNGKDIDGWLQRGGKATYKVEDAAIVGTSTMNTPNSFLCTPRDYSDFILEYEFKIDPMLNSGVQIRSNVVDKPAEITWEGKQIKIKEGVVHGYQIEIDPDPVKNRWWAAGIYDEGRRAWSRHGHTGPIHCA